MEHLEELNGMVGERKLSLKMKSQMHFVLVHTASTFLGGCGLICSHEKKLERVEKRKLSWLWYLE